jgi:triacylglycerol lipase
VTLEQSAGQLRRFIEERLGPDLRFSMVAYSMGGLVGRYYLQRLDGLPRLKRLVTISTPHHGTWTANFDGLAGSPFPEDLNSDITVLSAVPVTTISSPQDIGVQPPDISRLPLGSNVMIPEGRHWRMLTDDRVIRAVLAALTQQSRDREE